eukprot:3291445-Alexandrium_andersonii.AAC.1
MARRSDRLTLGDIRPRVRRSLSLRFRPSPFRPRFSSATTWSRMRSSPKLSTIGPCWAACGALIGRTYRQG